MLDLSFCEGTMRWVVGLTLVGAFALYYALSDTLPRAPITSTSSDEYWVEPTGPQGSAAPEVVQAPGNEERFTSDPSYVPARGIVLGVEKERFVAGPGSNGGFEESLTVRIFRGRNPPSREQYVGEARITRCTPDRIELELTAGVVQVHDFVISEDRDLPRDVYLPRAIRTQRPNPPQPQQQHVDVMLQAVAEPAGREIVSFGVPFPPGALHSAEEVSVWADGRELPVAARMLAPWRTDGLTGSPRSVLIQFEWDFQTSRQQRVTVRWDRPRSQSRGEFVSVASLLTRKSHPTKVHERPALVDYEEPRVLAALPPNWLCESWAAGPQVPAREDALLPEFEANLAKAALQPESGTLGVGNLSGEFAEQQLDRTIALYRLYFRTGDSDAALDAYRHATFYRRQIVTAEESQRGCGAFKLKHTRKELESDWLDVKYAYAEGPALHYLLTGDERFLQTLDDLCAFWDSQFGVFIRNDYVARPAAWNERFCAFAWLNWLHAYQVTGNPVHLERAREQCDRVYNMQYNPSDSHKPDGSWRHSSRHHGEGGHELGSSVWMSALLVDAVFQHWLLTGDERCPHMLAAYCEFAERYGIHWFSWSDQTKDATSEIPRWPQPWYFASAIHGGQDDTGGEADHNIEMGYLFLMGHYVRPDPRYLYWGRELIRTAPSRMHPRMFTWAYRASPQAAWFLRESAARSPNP